MAQLDTTDALLLRWFVLYSGHRSMMLTPPALHRRPSRSEPSLAPRPEDWRQRQSPPPEGAARALKSIQLKAGDPPSLPSPSSLTGREEEGVEVDHWLPATTLDLAAAAAATKSTLR